MIKLIKEKIGGKFMLLALVGVTGVGKSYYVEQIAKKLNFKKVNTIRTRPPRQGENPQFFMTEEKLAKMQEEGKIAYKFSVFGGEYGYLQEEIFSEENMIFEMHYTTIYDWKKVRPDIKTIYILPKDLEIAKQKTKMRNLSKEKEIERLKEIDEHFERIGTDEELRSQFDYFVENNYDLASEEKVISLVKEMLEHEK